MSDRCHRLAAPFRASVLGLTILLLGCAGCATGYVYERVIGGYVPEDGPLVPTWSEVAGPPGPDGAPPPGAIVFMEHRPPTVWNAARLGGRVALFAVAAPFLVTIDVVTTPICLLIFIDGYPPPRL